MTYVSETTARRHARREGFILRKQGDGYGLLDDVRGLPAFGFSGFVPDADLEDVIAFLSEA